MLDLNRQLNSTVHEMVMNNLTLEEALREFRKRWIVQVLEAHQGNQCHAARELRIHRNTLRTLIHQFGIDIRAIRKAA